jgi:acyl-CoA synthetase (AMP-forming)/AMP-acid ligase II
MPTAAALSDEDRTLCWKDVQRWTDAVACAWIRQGLPRGAVVATWLPNWIENYLIRLACEKAGLIWAPVPRAARLHELLPLLESSQASALIVAESPRRDTWGELQQVLGRLSHRLALCLTRGRLRPEVPRIEEMAAEEPSPDDLSAMRARSFTAGDIAFLLPTSGSTGIPKLCEYLLAGAVGRGRAQAALFRLTAHDVIVATVQGIGPSLIPYLAAPVVGASVVVLDRPDSALLLRVIEKRQVTIVCGVPAIYHDLVTSLERGRADVSSVRIWYSTGIAMPVWLAQRLEERSQGVVLSGYGAVDLGCWAVPAPGDPPEVRWFTAGRPRGGSELRVAAAHAGEEGEIWGRGPCSTTGYFGDPESTRAAWTGDGWFRTGDVGRFDANGNLVILGRTRDVINRGGQKIFPAEIEQLLERHPRIIRAAVVPFPDERLGERVCACVVPAGDDGPTLDDVVEFLRGSHVASYKLPERLAVLPDLPVTTGGKVDRAALRNAVAKRSREAV